MAKSLNEAFIKAYSKERAAGQQRKASVPEEENPYIVRIDTATVVIPEPHFLNARPTSPTALVGENLPASEASVARDSRAAIASQMLKAGGWQDSQTDAFVGGFPMLSTDYVPTSVPTPGAPKLQPRVVETGEVEPVAVVHNEVRAIRAELKGAGLSSELHEADLRVPPAVAPTPAASSTPQTQSNGLPPSPVHASETESAPPMQQGPAEVGVQTETSSAGYRETEELQAPIAPALSFAEVERVVDSVSEKRRAGGAIFRLDRPSYSSGHSEDGMESLAEEISEDLSEGSGAQSSMLEMPMSASVAKGLDETEFVSKSHSARAVEEGLRQARVRVFNPVWEVDSFQWPAVCTELLKQREKNMQRVAANLITACQEGLQVLAVTSPQGGEGRTTVACCLAMLAGRHGLNVAIVDGDIENPTLGYQTNLDVEHDWKEAISQELSLEEVAIHSIDDQVTLLPLLAPIDPREMSADDNRIAYMLHELAESFDLVIVDTGHMNSTASLVTSMGEQGLISAVVTVVDQRDTTRHRVDACVQRIRKIGISSIGLVENFTAADRL